MLGGYLIDFNFSDVKVIPTLWFPQGVRIDLVDIHYFAGGLFLGNTAPR